jgi:peptidylprolyl isomerase
MLLNSFKGLNTQNHYHKNYKKIDNNQQLPKTSNANYGLQSFYSSEKDKSIAILVWNIIFICVIAVFFIFSFSYKSVFANSNQDSNQQLDNSKDIEKVFLNIQTANGVIKIQTFDSIAPNHAKRVKQLADSGFYNNSPFHRVIDGFMVQGGDPTGTGTGGSGVKLKSEFSNISHKRGIVSMARASDPNSADSQFFIMLADNPHLDGQYTVFGKVVEGMDFVDKIKKAPSNSQSGVVQNPDKIIKMYTSKE